jgi:hypothetical protein
MPEILCFLFIVTLNPWMDTVMNFKNVFTLAVAVVATSAIFLTGCGLQNAKMTEKDKKAFLDSCLSSCESTALKSAPTADKAFVTKYCTDNCSCTADKVAEQFTMGEITENLTTHSGPTEKKLQAVVQQCSEEYTKKNTPGAAKK